MTKLYRRDHRLITKRIVIRGILILESPTCLGKEDVDSPIDLPLLRDSLDNKYALLTGSSIAGALRNYLRERDKGYRKNDSRNEIATKLFGDLFAYDDEKILSEQEKIELRKNDTQSSLIIDDAISTKYIQSELRDGVKINSLNGTAADQAKYDLELLQVGTEFPLCFELVIEKDSDETELLKGLTIALQGLEKSEISLGMKKHRGFGRCHVKEWQVWNFNLKNADEKLAWLTYDHWTLGLIADYPTHPFITDALGITLDQKEDKRDRLTITATFSLEGSLLIRSGHAETGRAPDVVHLKSKRNGQAVPVVSGTSLAGVLRHRSERIVNTLQNTSGKESGKEPNFKEPNFVVNLFGNVEKNQAQSSRITVHEAEIIESQDLVQNRIAIDRFTGGAYPGALFNEQPVWGNEKTELKITLEIRNPSDAEVGLLLLLLKDLWTSDLPVGGESSIGRGRLKGKEATLTWQGKSTDKWTIKQEVNSLVVQDLADDNRKNEVEIKEALQKFVAALDALINDTRQEEKP